MSYPAGHRAAVKKNIIDSARRLFNRHGFESASLNGYLSRQHFEDVENSCPMVALPTESHVAA